MEEKQAEKVAILMMNPKNGEIFAMVNVPEFNLNDPVYLKYAGRGRRSFGRGKAGGPEPDVEKRVHQ